jgi:hypothetical protein
MAQAFGIGLNRNADGSYDVQDPVDNPTAAATNILETVFNGLMGGNQSPDADEAPPPIGMNRLEQQAWTSTPEPDVPDEDPG